MSIKCLFNLALRQSLGMVESVLRRAGLNWSVPDFSTVCRRQKTLRVQLPYRASTTALDLLVDSTGIKFLGEGEWKRKKHGAAYRRQWRKLHLGIDAQTLEIRAIEVTNNSVEDNPGGCERAQRGAQSLPPAGMRHLEAVERLPPQKLGWTTKMHSFKRLGERVMARTFERQVVELHVRVALLNRFTQLGRPTTVPVAAMAWLRLGLGSSRAAFDLCNQAARDTTESQTPPETFSQRDIAVWQQASPPLYGGEDVNGISQVFALPSLSGTPMCGKRPLCEPICGACASQSASRREKSNP